MTSGASTFKTLVYSPEVRILIEGVDVSRDVVRGTVNRVTGVSSTLSFTLTNTGLRYTNPTPKFRRMDRVVIWMKRIAPVLVFSGYLDSVPGLQLYPSTVGFEASCTLKRLVYTYWDPGLPASAKILNIQLQPFGAWTPPAGADATPTGAPAADDTTQPPAAPTDTPVGSLPSFMTPDQGDTATSPTSADAQAAQNTSVATQEREISQATVDTGLGNMIKQLLIEVGGWDPEQVKVQQFPASFLGYVKEQVPEMPELYGETFERFKKLFEFDSGGTGAGSTGVAGGNLVDSTFTTIGPPANGRNYNDQEIVWIVTNAGWRGDDVKVGSSIIKAESGGRPDAINTANSDGSIDRGLWQINSIHDGKLPGQNRFDPAVSTELARMIYADAGGWTPWSTLVYHGTAQQHFATFEPLVAGGGTPPPGSGTSGGVAGAKTTGTASTTPKPGPTDPKDKPPASGNNMIDTNALPPMPSRMGSEEHWQPDTIKCARAVAYKWPELQTIGGWRPQDAYPDHPSGRAADIMIPNYANNVPLGDAIRDFLHANKGALGVQYTIWQQEYWGEDGRNKMEDRGSDTQNHFDHVHVTTYGNSGTGGLLDGSTSGALPGTPSGSATTTSKLAQNIFTYLFNPINYYSAMSTMATGRYASINDQPLINMVRTVCETRMCEFQSLPDGKFSAFFPDYFGLDGTAPVFKLEDVEMIDVKITINDKAMTTHVFTQGASDLNGGVIAGDVGYLRSPGTVTVEDEWLFKRLTEGSYFPPDVNTAEEMLFRYGIHPLKQTRNNIFSQTNQDIMLLLAMKLFMEKWADQYLTTISLTFMPELYPGMRIELVGHDLILYIKQVTHNFDYQSGFKTTVHAMAPMSVSRSPRTGSNPDGTTRASDADQPTPSGTN